MVTINPKDVSVPQFHAWLLGAVVPRPIAFASSIDKNGEVNLSPFSFFNCFGANPPLLIFSPARKGRDGSTKHTYENVLEVPEVVINVVNYSIVQQASLASTEYPKGVNEFRKAGFTEVPSVMVKPPRVGESPVAMECKVLQVIQTGSGGAAGNLVICQVLLMHVKEEVLDGHGSIDPFKLDAVARLGREWYCRVHGDSIFKVPRPTNKIAIGIDQLPDQIRNSTILTGNDLGLLASVERVPGFRPDLIARKDGDALHQQAQRLLREGRIEDAWKTLGYE